MKEIILSRGGISLIDDEDFEFISKFRWRMIENDNGNKYVISGQMVRMHRMILGLKQGDGKIVDHIDGNGLNNQRSNLRLCTKSQNGANRRKNKKGTSGYKGVFWNKNYGKWVSRVRVKVDGKRVFHECGKFDNELEAAKAYDKMALKVFGEFACTNLKEIE